MTGIATATSALAHAFKNATNKVEGLFARARKWALISALTFLLLPLITPKIVTYFFFFESENMQSTIAILSLIYGLLVLTTPYYSAGVASGLLRFNLFSSLASLFFFCSFFIFLASTTGYFPTLMVALICFSLRCIATIYLNSRHVLSYASA